MTTPAIILLILLLWLAFIYNQFIRERNLIREAWSGIDTQLKRRHDLIPLLVDSVKGYMQYEQSLLKEVTELRGRSMNSSSPKVKGEAERVLSERLRSLFALAEAYPDLKSSTTVLDLQKNLSELEDQIQLARRYYNGTVRNFNIRVESFPSNFVAQLFRFRQHEYFQLDGPTERAVPQIELSRR